MIAPHTSDDTVCTVSELNRQARLVLERGMTICRVRGEIANFIRAGSGHWYFTLKDNQASVRCVMFKMRNQFVDWQPRDGDQVELRAQTTLYEQRGDFQLQVDSLRKGGLGSLFEAFLKLKAKLEGEGLFHPGRKKTIPDFPRKIGIITSLQAAALRDVLTTLARRWPAATVIIYPTPVQGTEAARNLVNTLKLTEIRRECEVLLLVRGGGSLEDLYCFNDEAVARAIAASPIPIIAGVGHETDFTIADFVADLRAPTPTGAAEAATPSRLAWTQQLAHLNARLNQAETRLRHGLGQQLDALRAKLVHPRQQIELRRQRWLNQLWRLGKTLENDFRWRRQGYFELRQKLLGHPVPVVAARNSLILLADRLGMARTASLDHLQSELLNLTRHLEMLNPSAVLNRGYSIVRDAGGKIVRSHQEVEQGQHLDILLGEGTLIVEVKESRI